MQLRHPNRPRGLNFVSAELDQFDQAMPPILFDCVTASVSKLLSRSEMKFRTAFLSKEWTEKQSRRLFGRCTLSSLTCLSSGLDS